MALAKKSHALCLLAILTGGATTSLSRAAAAAEPTTAECLAASEDSVSLTKAHQLRATLTKLAICSADPCPAEVRTECLARVSATEASIPTLVFEAKDATGENLFEVKVKMDGELLADRLSGLAVAVDPGEHTFTFEAPGRLSVEKKLAILEGEKLRRERVDLEPIVVPAPAASVPAAPPKSEVAVEQEKAPPRKPSLGAGRTLALVLGGAGVVATGVGVAYGVVTMGRRDDAKRVCPNLCTDSSGVEAWNRARSAGDISTAAFVVGGAAIAGGVVLWVLAKPRADGTSSARVSVDLGGLRLEGSW